MSEAKNDQEVISLLKHALVKLDKLEGKVEALVRVAKEQALKEKPAARPYRSGDMYQSPKGTVRVPGSRRPGPRPTGGRKHEGKKEGGPRGAPRSGSSESKFYHGAPFNKRKPGGKGGFAAKKRP